MTAQPIGSVRPATTTPASQTSQPPRRVVSSATTTGWPAGSSASAWRINAGLTTAWSSGGPAHQRRTRRRHDRPEPACSAGRARASAAGVDPLGHQQAQHRPGDRPTTVVCVRPSTCLTQR